MKKTLCCSVNSLCTQDGIFYEELEKVLLEIQAEYGLFIYSGDKDKKMLLPTSLQDSFHEVDRGIIKNGQLLKQSFEKFSTTKKDYVILGATDNDFFLSNHSNVLLLAAFWSNMDEKIEKYGLRIKSPFVLKYFFDHVLKIEEPWYYRVNINNNAVIYSLMSSNTMYTKNDDIKEINNQFNQLLKKGDTSFIQLIKYYFVCALNIIEDIDKVDLWTYYPSSDDSNNPILEEFSETSRYLFGKTRKKHPLFIRHKNSGKRHYLNKEQRLKLACNSQFDTIHLNPRFKEQIKDKVICIIDDYSTYGSSSETARILLEKAEARKVIFITFGKFGSGNNYNKFEYEINGDIFTNNYKYNKLNHEIINGETIDNSHEIIETLKVMI